MNPLERQIEAYLVKRVKEMGGIAAKHTSPGRAGDPDRLIKLPGKPAALLELKRPGENPRPLQLVRIGEWLEVGMLASWADSKDTVDLFLKKVLDQ